MECRNWYIKKDGGQDDKKNVAYDDDMEQNEIYDLDEDLLHLRNRLGDNMNDANKELQYIEEGGILNEDRGQGNHVGNAHNIQLANNIPLEQNEHFGGANNNDDDDNHNNDNDNRTLQGYTPQYRYIIREPDTIPIGNIEGHRINTMQTHVQHYH